MFWADLKRRKVVQVAVTYAIVAWLVVQVIVAVETPLSLPSWTDTLVIVLLVVGFPIALVMSWMFDLTPEGLKRTQVATAAPARPAGGLKIEYVLLALLGVVTAWLVYRIEVQRADAPTAGTSTPATLPVEADAASASLPKSVAVLPLDNLSPSADDEYFAAGIHEEILNQLAKLSDLSVIARTSVLKYADTTQSITEIARELNVGTIVEGSVRYAGNRVRVTAQFIDAATGTHRWSEAYDRDRADIFAIQTDIATKIAAALDAELSGEEQRRIEAVPTSSPEAYALYLKAVATFDGTAPTVDSARGFVEQSIELDPSFAKAHAFKATLDVLTLGTIAGGPVSEDVSVRAEVAQRARASAERALALDPTTGEAHAVSGWLLLHEWRWAEAGAAFARAVELSPNVPGALASRAVFLLIRGDYEGAVPLLERAVTLDPASPVWRYGLAGVRVFVGDTAGFAEGVREGLEFDPSFFPLRTFASQLALARGDSALAESEARTVERLLGSSPTPAAASDLAGLYSTIGLTEDAARLVAYVEQEAARRPVSAQTLALLYLGVGQQDRGYDWLDTAIRTHDTYGYVLYVSLGSRSPRSRDWDNPRLQRARRDMGLADPL